MSIINKIKEFFKLKKALAITLSAVVSVTIVAGIVCAIMLTGDDGEDVSKDDSSSVSDSEAISTPDASSENDADLESSEEISNDVNVSEDNSPTDSSEISDSSEDSQGGGSETDAPDDSTVEISTNDSESVGNDSSNVGDIGDNSVSKPDADNSNNESTVESTVSSTVESTVESEIQNTTSTPNQDNASSKPEDTTSSANSSTPQDDSSVPEDNTSTPEVDIPTSDSMFTKRDLETTYTMTEAVRISLNRTSISCNAPAKVTVSGMTATIKDEGTYLISGSLTNGYVKVDAEETDKVQIVLNNVTIASSTFAPIYSKQADKVFITIPSGTSNTLISGSSFITIDENNVDSAIFSKTDVTLNGGGNLTIQSPAGHGIVSKDDLVITGGYYNITSSGHAICGKNSVRLGGGTYVINAGKDGFHAENIDSTASGFFYSANINGSVYADITAGGDGISGQGYTTFNGGSFKGKCGGGSGTSLSTTLSGKGVKSVGVLTVNNGTAFDFDTADDGINATGNIVVSGGNIDITTAFDGIQTEGTITLANGTVNIKSGGGSSAYSNGTESAKGIKSVGDLTIKGGAITLNCADDGVHSNAVINVNGGTVNIETGDDGLHADTTLNIGGGTINITKSYEGLEATNIVITNGNVSLVASDDGLNAAGGVDSSGSSTSRPGRPGDKFSSSTGSIKISGGTLFINANGDGIDSNGTLEVTGGNIELAGPTSGGNGSLDYDATAKISGGTIMSTGSTGMAMNFSSVTNQGSILYNLSSCPVNTTVTVKDSAGNVVLTWTAKKTFASILVSSPDIKIGGTYTISAGSYSSSFTIPSNGIAGSSGGGGGFRP